MLSGWVEEQMTMRQPAAVARRAAVSFVAMPPVPHSDPAVAVSTYHVHPSIPQQVNAIHVV